jgi:hypothetical protein
MNRTVLAGRPWVVYSVVVLNDLEKKKNKTKQG